MDSTPKKQSLASRLSLWIVLSGAIIFLIVLSSNYMLSRKLLESYVEQLARETAFSSVQKVETVLHSVATSADSLAAVVATPDISQQHIRQMLQAFVTHNEQIFGMTVALEPGVLPQATSENGFAPYYYKTNNDTANRHRESAGLAYADLASPDYDYRSKPWYQDTRRAGHALWSEPYMDEGGGNVHMVTYSTPITLDDGRTFAGVATADIRLSWLDEIIQHSQIGQTGYGMIVSGNDTIIAHPDKTLHMKPLNRTGISNENWERYLHSKTSASAEYFSTACKLAGGQCWVAIKTLSNSNNSSHWKIIIVIPQQMLIAKIRLLTFKVAAIAIAGLAVLFLVVIMITRRQTRPLAELASATRDIGAGNLEGKLPAPPRMDEIGSLSNDFNTMREALKQYIADLQETTARQQKLESEIRIAHDIQMSMIPGGGNASIDEKSYQLFALLRPARSVGGDLYYYHQDDRHLHFIIGDVSDKGVPAALFMAKAVTLYTRALKEKLLPGETLGMMNDILSQDNDACMFVTALCGRYDLESGEILMANAGHMDPILQNTDGAHEQPVNGATALGLMENIDYPDVSFKLTGDSMCIMYTDGITEAHNSQDEQYGEERLLALLDNCRSVDAAQTGNRIISDVSNFAGSREQFDDITLLIIRRKNNETVKPS